VNWGLYQALSVLIGAIVSVYVSAFVIDALAPSFGSEKNLPRSVQLVAYSFTPAWIGGMLSIFPPLAFLGGLFGLYGLYLLYMGMPRLKRTPADKQTTYFIVSLVVIIVVYLVIGWILSTLFMNIFGLSYSSGFRMQ
ncbi:MAG TPA: Yip1 family protein, partial [Chitinophagaceae bacterium]|nr:Yip1 family protein [Chitinophagaceae bacterium]